MNFAFDCIRRGNLPLRCCTFAIFQVANQELRPNRRWKQQNFTPERSFHCFSMKAAMWRHHYSNSATTFFHRKCFDSQLSVRRAQKHWRRLIFPESSTGCSHRVCFHWSSGNDSNVLNKLVCPCFCFLISFKCHWKCDSLYLFLHIAWNCVHFFKGILH